MNPDADEQNYRDTEAAAFPKYAQHRIPRWGAHAPSRAGDGASPSRTFSPSAAYLIPRGDPPTAATQSNCTYAKSPKLCSSYSPISVPSVAKNYCPRRIFRIFGRTSLTNLKCILFFTLFPESLTCGKRSTTCSTPRIYSSSAPTWAHLAACKPYKAPPGRRHRSAHRLQSPVRTNQPASPPHPASHPRRAPPRLRRRGPRQHRVAPASRLSRRQRHELGSNRAEHPYRPTHMMLSPSLEAWLQGNMRLPVAFFYDFRSSNSR